MRNYFLAVFVLTAMRSMAQYPVNVCNAPTQLTPAMINAGNIYYDNCAEFPTGQNFNFSGTSNKEVHVTNSVKIKPGFKAGSYTSGGKMKITVLPSGNLEVASFRYSDLSQVEKLEKFELGIKFPPDVLAKVNNFINRTPNTTKLNPFLDWELDGDAIFTHVSTGTIKRIEGFYYDDFERDFVNNSWQNLNTEHRMRFRFAPPLTGAWTCTIYLKVNGIAHSQSALIPFTVINSTDPGFVTVHPNKKNLQRANRIIMPVGANFSTPVKGVNTNPSTEDTDNATTLGQWMEYQNDIDEYRQQGGQYIRTIQFGWASLLEFVDKGDYSKRMHYAWEQDRLLDYCAANDVLIQFNLLEQDPLMKYGNYHLDHWDWGNYAVDGVWLDSTNYLNYVSEIFPSYCYSDGNGQFKEPYEMFMLENDLKYHEQRTRYYIARYGYSTNIYMWELISEPYHLNQSWPDEHHYVDTTELGANVRNAITNYHNRIANYIKSTLGHTEHLISIGVYNTFPEHMEYFDQSATNPNIDVITTNPYSSQPDKLVSEKEANENNVINATQEDGEKTFFRTVMALRDAAGGKPLLISEFGAVDGVEDCTANSHHQVDMMTMGFCGVAGYNSWIGGFPNHESSWTSTIRAKNHFNSDGVINVLSDNNGNWTQGREEVRYLLSNEDLKEQQYYISYDKEKAAGYIKNRTHNSFTTKIYTPSYCDTIAFGWNQDWKNFNNIPWDRNKLTIQGLKPNTDYRVHWFRGEIPNNGYMSSYCFNTNSNGEHKLQHPQLYVHPDALQDHPFTPAVWYMIEQYNCQQGLDDDSIEILDDTEIIKIISNPDLSTLSLSRNAEEQLLIYPNPTDSYLTLKSTVEIDEIIILNNVNKKVMSLVTDEKNYELDLSHLAAGTYYINIPKLNVNHKIIKL